jgi:hypothetical protein
MMIDVLSRRRGVVSSGARPKEPARAEKRSERTGPWKKGWAGGRTYRAVGTAHQFQRAWEDSSTAAFARPLGLSMSGVLSGTEGPLSRDFLDLTARADIWFNTLR